MDFVEKLNPSREVTIPVCILEDENDKRLKSVMHNSGAYSKEQSLNGIPHQLALFKTLHK
ncbi:MAG: hypothetical protein ACQETQ_12495 [Spirochaetota bacterium]